MALRGIVGIEAAIVLIAFVLVASALAFVAINMGMFSAQKSKEVMAKAYDSATHALDIAGDTLAYVDSTHNVKSILVPLKLTAGTAPIDLEKTTIRIIASSSNGSVINASVVNGANCSVAWFNSTTTLDKFGQAVSGSGSCAWIFATYTGSKPNSLLEPGELVYFVFNITNGVPAYSKINVEIVPPIGAPLVATYTIPPTVNSVSSGFVDLIVGS